MTHDTDKPRSAPALRKRILSAPPRHWSLADLDDPTPAELRELSRLVSSGELVRVRRGIYWRGVDTPFGMSPPPDAMSIRAITGELASGPAGASAAVELGLSSQVPTTMLVAAPRRLTAPGGIPVRFLSRPARTERLRVGLRPAEIALLEVLESWEHDVEAAPLDALARIRGLARAGVIDLNRIAKASSTEPPVVRARLRALLVALDLPLVAARVARPRSMRLRDVEAAFLEARA